MRQDHRALEGISHLCVSRPEKGKPWPGEFYGATHKCRCPNSLALGGRDDLQHEGRTRAGAFSIVNRGRKKGPQCLKRILLKGFPHGGDAKKHEEGVLSIGILLKASPTNAHHKGVLTVNLKTSSMKMVQVRRAGKTLSRKTAFKNLTGEEKLSEKARGDRQKNWKPEYLAWCHTSLIEERSATTPCRRKEPFISISDCGAKGLRGPAARARPKMRPFIESGERTFPSKLAQYRGVPSALRRGGKRGFLERGEKTCRSESGHRGARRTTTLDGRSNPGP